MKNSNVKKLMICNYGNRCWLNGVIAKDNQLTYHHCLIPKRNGGKATEENGALLTHQRHNWLNKVERVYPKLIKEVNIYMSKYKGRYPEEIEWRINQIFALVNPNREEKRDNNERGRRKKRKRQIR